MLHTEYYKDGTPCECDEMHRDYYFPSGSVWTEIPYVNGKKHGTIKYYYETGGLSSEVPYENDRVHGITKWYYKTGVLRSTTPCTNGKYHDIKKEYQKSGALSALRAYNHRSFRPIGCPMENFV